jgi:hypothetical protein
MIKYINRILYALIAALGLMFVYNLTVANVKTSYLKEQGQIELDAGNYEYFVSSRFYDETPIFEETITSFDSTYHVLVYEVAFVKLINEQYFVTDGLFFIMHQTDGTPIEGYFDVFFTTESDIEVQYLGFRVLDFPLYSALDQDNESNMVPRSLFVKDGTYQNITGIRLSLGEEVILEIPLLITDAEYNVKFELETSITTNNEVPSEAFGNVSYAPVIIIDSKNQVMINLSIYIVAIILFTVGLFTYQKKRLGKKEPTEGVQKDVAKLHEQASKKR